MFISVEFCILNFIIWVEIGKMTPEKRGLVVTFVCATLEHGRKTTFCFDIVVF